MTRSDVLRLAREGMGALPLYSPDLAACAVDLSDNTNLWGAPPAALRALREAPVRACLAIPHSTPNLCSTRFSSMSVSPTSLTSAS
jgi:histidinol-phosphate aminotransferase